MDGRGSNRAGTDDSRRPSPPVTPSVPGTIYKVLVRRVSAIFSSKLR